MEKEQMKSWATWKEQAIHGLEGRLIANRRASTGLPMFRATHSWDKHGYFRDNSLEFDCSEIKGSPNQNAAALEDLLPSHSGKDAFWINLLRGYLDDQYQLFGIDMDLGQRVLRLLYESKRDIGDKPCVMLALDRCNSLEFALSGRCDELSGSANRFTVRFERYQLYSPSYWGRDYGVLIRG